MDERGAGSAKPSTELFQTKIFLGAAASGDQNFKNCGPGGEAPAFERGFAFTARTVCLQRTQCFWKIGVRRFIAAGGEWRTTHLLLAMCLLA